jgi:5-oxoprolinase (ATP-hydrolysing)
MANGGDVRYKVWVDVGGTFTDCFVVDSQGRRLKGKVLSSGVTKGTTAETSHAAVIFDHQRIGDPDNFWNDFELLMLDSEGQVEHATRVARFDSQQGCLELVTPLRQPPRIGATYELRSSLEAPVMAVRRLLRCSPDQALPQLDVRLGTTRGTNALLTRTGARVGFLVTSGFGDCLMIGSQERPELFALSVRKPAPLTNDVVEVYERLAADGSVLRSLDEAHLTKQLQVLRQRGIESLSICFMHAYRNNVHELRAEQLARQLGFTEISLSSHVVPLIKLLSRAETTTLDAYLNPILATYVTRVWEQFGGPENAQLRLMTSGGQLVRADAFRGRDSILSGPAGGGVALAEILRSLRETDPHCAGVIGFDMGGTSTDVSRCEGPIVRQFETRKAGVRVMTPTMAIHTVAAGGGSICRCEGARLLVGPESAGSDPGPACYGRGGPLTVTDLNLVLGRVVEDRFPFTLDRLASERKLDRMLVELRGHGVHFESREALAEGFWNIAVHHMAEAVRTVTTTEGADPRPMRLVSFGGAAGQHACAVASALGVQAVVDHPDASVLSALGMGLAPIGRFASHGLYCPLAEVDGEELYRIVEMLRQQTFDSLKDDIPPIAPVIYRTTTELRYQGTETTLELALEPCDTLATRFSELHQSSYGYVRAGRAIECVTVRVEAECAAEDRLSSLPTITSQATDTLVAKVTQPLFFQHQWISAGRWNRESLLPGDRIVGPAVIASDASTLVVEPHWIASQWTDGTWIVERSIVNGQGSAEVADSTDEDSSSLAVQLEIIARRLEGIAEQMGEVLRRTAVSVNVKERLDYSCAIFRRDGTLVAGAMHVPVHLGAMGHTVRSIAAQYPTMSDGDCYVSNDPYAGGSHLPDVTVVSPVFVEHCQGIPDFFVASRAHHAEIGGLTPGSMPPMARSLAEEGVVIRNFALIQAGQSHADELEHLLASGPYPSRNPRENMADIAAQMAAGRRGAEDLRALARHHGVDTLEHWMTRLLNLGADAIDDCLRMLDNQTASFTDWLDDQASISVRLYCEGQRLVIDFAGTSGVHPHGWNATPAIVSAAVLYVLRCLSNRHLPLSEGVLQRLDLRIPVGLLNPPHHADLDQCPAVVAGNVETSQRVVDCLLGALGVAAASQGTMNNLLIGDATFGYYETICGGAGATPTAIGESAVHTHMTNTRITDPEILESRYPLRLHQFSIRRGSGGAGQNRGGDGATRQIEVLRPLTVSLLTSRRKPNREDHPQGPYGAQGGSNGLYGRNILIRRDGEAVELPPTVSLNMVAGEQIRIETPGGGGWGHPAPVPPT